MRNNSNIPTPSASLIHEIRMIAQHFFRAKTIQSTFGQPSASPAILCVKCIRERKKSKAAIVVVNGNSACLDHIN